MEKTAMYPLSSSKAIHIVDFLQVMSISRVSMPHDEDNKCDKEVELFFSGRFIPIHNQEHSEGLNKHVASVKPRKVREKKKNKAGGIRKGSKEGVPKSEPKQDGESTIEGGIFRLLLEASSSTASSSSH